MVKQMKRVAFLNCKSGFHDDHHEKFCKMLVRQGITVQLIDNLTNEPEKLFRVKGCDTIVVGAVGIEGTGSKTLNPLFKAFSHLMFAPQRVIFAPSETPFLRYAKNFKQTNFYRLDYIDFDCYGLEALNNGRET